MKLDFTGVRETKDFVNIPEGTYLCCIAEVQAGLTRSGDPRWGLRLVVDEGEFIGRQAAWDGLAFSQKGMERTRRVFAAIGLPSEGQVEVQPEDLVGRHAFVTVRTDEYRDPVTQDVVRRLKVPYDGYRAAGVDAAGPESAPPPSTQQEDSDRIPF